MPPAPTDLIELVGKAEAAGEQVVFLERSMGPGEPISIAGIGYEYEIVSTREGAATLDASGTRLDTEAASHPLIAAQRLWKRLAANLTPGLEPSPIWPLALGGFAFDPRQEPQAPWSGFPGVRFRVPRVALGMIRDNWSVWGDQVWLDNWLGTPMDRARPRGLSIDAESTSAPGPLLVTPERPASEWLAGVRAATQRLRTGAVRKVVLASELLVAAEGGFSAPDVAAALRAAHPSCLTYLVTGDDHGSLVGASPELLVRKAGSRAVCQPMAGSIARGDDSEQDRRLEEELLASAKNSAEHSLTAEHVAAALRPYATRLWQGEPEIVRFTNIQHLATTIEAELKPASVGLLDLAAVLHPTPAVGGVPPSAAALIKEFEAVERGWYAGAVGWMDASGNGELALAIRCGLLGLETARLFAGNGIMPDSDPEAELEETEIKLQVLLRALDRSLQLSARETASQQA
jgi:menaquinone-specific isochorismate synthase